MQQQFIIHQHHSHLILFFTGWGMDETPFLHYQPKDSDLHLCYDYRSLAFDASELLRYERITLVAWSMGVWAASQVIPGSGLRMMQSIAINGTIYPIDDLRGIPTQVFQGTLLGLTDVTLQKFYRRMCSDKEALQLFLLIAPKRPVEELREELAAIGEQSLACPASTFHWQQALLGSHDRIFPPANQYAAWEATDTLVVMGSEAHYDAICLKTTIEKL